MRRYTAVAIGIVVGASLGPTGRMLAQSPTPERLLARAVLESGRVQGLVRDGVGNGVADASVMAVGQMIVAARSDSRGHFALSLPPGDYILKASRSGYVSNYREPVRVLSTTRLERTITLTREGPAAEPIEDDAYAHTDLAWRLRHLTRSVLRDGPTAVPIDPANGGLGRSDTMRTGSATDMMSPLAAALAGTDFRGQLNFVTTTTARPLSVWAQDPWPRSIAHVALGAPIVGHGAWQVRAAVASGDGSSWNMLGEYTSDPAEPHVWRLRLSYAAQGYTTSTDQLAVAVAEARTVAGVAGQDRWHVNPRLDLEYGLRAERFDYLVNPQLFSARGGLTARLTSNLFLMASGARSMVAPGVDEFLPPTDGGPWLPAEQLFAPLWGRGSLRAEEVQHVETGLAHQFGSGSNAPIVHVRRFWERSTDQMATIFGASGTTTKGQYAVAPVGSVDLAGWGIGVSGQFSPHLRGQIEYARVTADWQTARWVDLLRAVAPSMLRGDTEHTQDLTATLDADVPRTSTRVSVIYRASNAFSASRAGAVPLPGSRFDLQVHQELPYRPTRNGRLELIFGVRNLFRDARSEASWYDELLAVGAPVRLNGGIQLRF
jgi:hypothetical protein